MLKFISDAGSNHNQDLKRALELVRVSKFIGCYGVKFQLFRPELLFSKEFPQKIKKMQQWALPVDFIPEIANECNKQQIKFICTPFDLQSVFDLIPFVDILKIGSYELLYDRLIEAVAETGIPWMFSAGMLEKAYNILPIMETGIWYNNRPWAVLHCNSNYPAKPENCNLYRIGEIRYLVGNRAEVGWSDHTKSEEVIIAAVSQGATVIEFHLDLSDGKGLEYSFGHCWKPLDIEETIIDAQQFSKLDGFFSYGDHRWINSNTMEEEARKWRMDPKDGKRPLRMFRKELSEKENL